MQPGSRLVHTRQTRAPNWVKYLLALMIVNHEESTASLADVSSSGELPVVSLGFYYIAS